MALLALSTAYTATFLMVQSSDHITPLTGATVTVNISKAGGAFAAPSGGATATEIANGWYKIALSTTDTNTSGDLDYHCTAASGDPTDFRDQVGANLSVTSNIKKNQALNAFPFVMTNALTHNPQPALTVIATRSIDGAAFSPCANAPTEIANGIYVINLAAGDLNGNCISLRFTAVGADDTVVPIVTQPL